MFGVGLVQVQAIGWRGHLGWLFLDESDDDGTFPMDMAAIPRDRYYWVVAKFSKSALSRHFGQARDSLTPFFETFSRYKLYHGGII